MQLLVKDGRDGGREAGKWQHLPISSVKKAHPSATWCSCPPVTPTRRLGLYQPLLLQCKEGAQHRSCHWGSGFLLSKQNTHLLGGWISQKKPPAIVLDLATLAISYLTVPTSQSSPFDGVQQGTRGMWHWYQDSQVAEQSVLSIPTSIPRWDTRIRDPKPAAQTGY